MKSIGCCSSTALSDAVGMPDAWCQNGRFFAYHGSSKTGPTTNPTPRGEIFLAIFRDMTFFHHDHLIFWALAQALFLGGVTLGVPFNSLEYSQCWKYQAYLFEAEKCIALLPIAWNSPSWKHSKKSLTVFDYILCGILWVIRGEVVRTDCFFSRNLQYRRYSSHEQTQLAPNKKRHKTDFFWVTCVNPPPKKTNLWLFFICRHINSLLFPYFSSTKEHRLVEQKYQTFLYTSRCGQTNVNMTRGVWWVTDVLMFQLLIGW